MKHLAVLTIVFAFSSNVLLQPQEAGDKVKTELAWRPRIFNGTDVTYNQYPFFVFYAMVVRHESGRKKILCGGSLVSSHWVITTGHCFKYWNQSTQIHLYHASEGGQSNSTLIKNIELHRHPEADVALFKFSETLSSAVSTIRLPLPFEDDEFVDTRTESTLVGAGGPIGEEIGILKKKQVVLSAKNQNCTTMFKQSPNIYFVCNYEITPLSFACNEDTGSPVFSTGKTEKMLLAMVTSGDHDCHASLKSPPDFTVTYFVRVSSVMSWILHKLDMDIDDSIKDAWSAVHPRRPSIGP